MLRETSRQTRKLQAQANFEYPNEPFVSCTASFLIELASCEHFTACWPLESMLLNAIPIILPSAAVGLAQR